MAKNKLQEYFPMIRTREEVRTEIGKKENLQEQIEDLLKCLLGKKVTVIKVLPNESSRFKDETAVCLLFG